MKNTLGTIRCQIVQNEILLDKPFKYFLDELKSLPYSKVVLTDNEGFVGEGEAAHAIDINGELQAQASSYAPYIENALSKMTGPIDSIATIHRAMKMVRLYVAHNTGLLCGVEQALFGILSKRTGKNLTELLGGAKHSSIAIQITLPYQADFEGYKESFEGMLSKHAPEYVKFKIGKNLPLELEAIRYLKKLRLGISISVDANQAFSDPEEAVQFAESLKASRVSWAEQLLHKDDISGLRMLKMRTGLPLMVDEGLHTPLEAEYFAKERLADSFNIKLAKTGGILKAIEIINIAKHFNLPVMLGSMLHGKLGMEYNLGFALSQDFITHDFFSYFSVEETKNLGYITDDLSVNSETLYGKMVS